MVRLQLSIKADLENVTDLKPASKDFEFFFKVVCNSCHEPHPKHVSLNRLEEHELQHGKGSTAHFVWKCGMCKRESSAKFELADPIPYTLENSGQFWPFLVLDCRGLEFTEFDPRGEWTCTGTGKKATKFNVENLGSEDWYEYDEAAGQEVKIEGFESQWARA